MSRIYSVRRPACWLTLALTLLFCASVASAHARLERSEPKADSTLKQPPKTLELWFSEELEASMSTVTVTDQVGRRVDKNNAALSEGNKKLQVELEDLGTGTYTVDWKSLSTDGHTMKGKFTFTVTLAGGATTAPTTAPPAGAQQIEQPKPTGQPTPQTSPPEPSQESGGSRAQSVVRWLEYLAMMTLFGGFAFRLLILGPALRGAEGLEAGERAAGLAASERRFVRLSWWALALLALTTLAALVLQTSAVMDTSLGEALSPARLYEVLTRTGYGGPWQLQAATAAALALVVYLLSRRAGTDDYERHLSSAANPGLLWAGSLLAALMVVAPSLTGHARAAAAEYHFTVFSDWLHIVAAGFWVGGLFHLALTLTRGVSGLEGRQRLRVLDSVIPSFTRLAVVSTIVLALTGVYNSWIHVDGLRALWGTPYGITLLIKVAIFLLMVAIGGVNTFVIHPRAKRVIEGDAGTAAHEHIRLDRSFYRSVGVEAALGVAALLAAAVLVFLQPAREHPARTARANGAGEVVTRPSRSDEIVGRRMEERK
jgi:copper transport protein